MKGAPPTSPPPDRPNRPNGDPADLRRQAREDPASLPFVLTTARAAAVLGLPEARVRALISDGLIKASRSGHKGRWLVSTDSVLAFASGPAARSAAPSSPPPPPAPPARTATPPAATDTTPRRSHAYRRGRSSRNMT